MGSMAVPSLVGDGSPARSPIRSAAAVAVVIVALFVTSAMGLAPAARELLAVLAAGLATGGVGLRWTALVALSTWALVTGFVVHRFGQLTFGSADLVRLMAVTVLVYSGAALTARTGVRKDEHGG